MKWRFLSHLQKDSYGPVSHQLTTSAQRCQRSGIVSWRASSMLNDKNIDKVFVTAFGSLNPVLSPIVVD